MKGSACPADGGMETAGYERPHNAPDNNAAKEKEEDYEGSPKWSCRGDGGGEDHHGQRGSRV